MQPQKRQNIISVIFLWHPLAGLPQWNQIIFEFVFVFVFLIFVKRRRGFPHYPHFGTFKTRITQKSGTGENCVSGDCIRAGLM